MKIINALNHETKPNDLIARNLARLKELFPDLVTEGQDGPLLDFDVLRRFVGDRIVSDAEEQYGLNWRGKQCARQLTVTPAVGTLRPCPEESVDWDTTKNIVIEGDNLEVLKLLQETYRGKVKLIYIDPPYNTGKDFLYSDDYKDKNKTGQKRAEPRNGVDEAASSEEAPAWRASRRPSRQAASAGVQATSLGGVAAFAASDAARTRRCASATSATRPRG